ncbi:MAG: hypothetical protein QXO71_11650 [Candidatus Jordarchaeaceae archaeon]
MDGIGKVLYLEGFKTQIFDNIHPKRRGDMAGTDLYLDGIIVLAG